MPLAALLPVVFYRRQFFFEKLKTKCLVGICLGGGMAFYAAAILYTTILQTTLLFYMSPIWATLLSRAILKEKINAGRWLAIAVGFAGILLILSGEDTSVISSDLSRGDVFALLSGLLWGYGTVVVKGSTEIPAIDMVPSQYFWATIISVVLLDTTISTQDFRVPDFNQWLNALPIVFGFYVVITLPTIFICTRCAQILSPGRTCLLMMSEVLVAGITAPIFAGEKISALEWVAGLMILGATVIEVYSSPGDTEGNRTNSPD